MRPEEYLAIDASWTKGVNAQKGKLVVRPHYAVFVPTEAAVNVLAKIGTGTLAAMAGYVTRVLPSQFADIPSYVAALIGLDAAEFDAHVHQAAPAANWFIATPANSALLFKKVPLFNRYKFWIKRGADNVGAVFGVPGKQLAVAEPMLAGWPRQ